MKLKKNHSHKYGYCLVGESRPEEDLIYVEAEKVKGGCDDVLLTFSYEPKGKAYKFRYYLETAKQIDSYLKRPLTNEYFESILISFLSLARMCEKTELSIQRVLFQREFIFFDPAKYSLRFVYVPLKIRGQVSDPLKAIEHIMQQASFDNGATKSHADKVLDYARSCTLFNWVDYENLLQELGVIEVQENEIQSSLGKASTQPVDCRRNYGFDFVHMQQKEVSSQSVNTHEAHSARLSASNMEKCAYSPEADLMGSAVFALEVPNLDKRWILKDGEYIIGCSEDCRIVLQELGVSRHHAKISVSRGKCFVEDMNSTNGTGINGRRLKPHHASEIVPGDIVQIALVQLRIVNTRVDRFG